MTEAKPQLRLNELILPSPEVFVPFSHLHFIRNQLLALDLGQPGERSQLVKWHPTTQQAFEETPPWTWEPPIAYEIYTDGSSAYLEKERQGAAAAVLIVNTVYGPRFGGTYAFDLKSPATAPHAEITAMLVGCYILGH